MEEQLYSSESEHLYYKLCAAQELLNCAKNNDDHNNMVTIISGIQKDILKTEDKELIEKSKSLVVFDDDDNFRTIKNGTKKIVICIVITVLSLAFSVILARNMQNKAVLAQESLIISIKNEFREDLEGELEKIRTDNIDRIDYEINDIKLFGGKEGTINVSVYVYYDSTKYRYNSHGFDREDSISFDIENMYYCDEYKTSSGWKFRILTNCFINGKNKGSNSSVVESWERDKASYVAPDGSLWIYIIGISIAVVMLVIIVLTAKKIEKAQENIKNKTKLVKIKGTKGKITVLFIVILFLVILGTGVFYYVRQNQKQIEQGYTRAEELFKKQDYDAALLEYQGIGDYNDSNIKIQLIQSMQNKAYDNAIMLCDSLGAEYTYLKDSLITEKNEYYYTLANECFQNKNFADAEKYYRIIPEYKDVGYRLSQMDDYVNYYKALECELKSVTEAMEIYKTLPEGFMDVKSRMDKYSAYMECLGKFGYTKGFITDGVWITEFNVDSDGKMYVHTNFDRFPVDPPSKDGYLFSYTESEYGRTWNIRSDEVNLTIDGEDYKTMNRENE